MICKPVPCSLFRIGVNLVVITCLTLLFSSSASHAQTATYTGNSGGEWNTAGNWDIGVPGTGTNAAIRSTTAVNYNIPMTAASFRTLALSNSLTINTSGFMIDEGGGSTAAIVVGTNATLNITANNGVTVSNSAGAITVANFGTITLGNNAFLLVTNSTGTSGFNVGTSGNPATGGIFTINSGAMATLDKTLNIAGVPSRVFVNGGTLNCLAGSKISENNTDGSQRLAVGSGTVNLGDFSVTRCSGTGGLLITNGVVTATSIQIGTANSTAFSIVMGGTLTNTGTFTIFDTPSITASGDRRSQFLIKGGTVVSTSPTGIIIDNQINTDSGPSAGGGGLGGVLSVSGGTLLAEKISLLKDNTISNAYAGFFLSSGSVYLGSGGLVRNTGGAHVGETLALTGGTIGAQTDWSSSAAMGLTNTVTFKAADIAGIPHDISLSGSLNGAGLLSKTGGGKLTLSGNDNYTGGTTIGAGQLALGSSTGLPRGGTLSIGSSGNAATFNLAGFNAFVSSLAVGGGASAANQLITNSSASTSTLTFSNSAANATYSGMIAGGNPIAITVLGGTLTCSGQNNYPGNFFISGGTLALSGAGSTFSGSSIVLSNTPAVLDLTGMDVLALSTGQSVAGYGTVTGSVTATNTTITPGLAGFGGTLTISSNLTLNGFVTNQFDLVLDPNSPANDQIIVGGALNVSGANTIKLNPLAGSLIEGTYHLFVCGSVGSGDTSNFQITGSPGSGLVAAVSVTSTSVDLIVSEANGADRVWVGDGTANLWDLVSTNWLKGGLPNVFTNGNFVIFDDSSTNQTVNLTGTLLPADITVDATNDYVFTGAGRLSGALSFTKTNSGALIILMTNDYNGVTTIGQGTLQVGNGITSGLLGSGTIVDGGMLLMQQPNIAMLSNAISGDGSLVQAGAGTLTLVGSNTFDGGLLISAGTLQIGNGGTAGNGNITNNSALVFNNSGNNTVNGVISGSGSLTVSGSGTVTLTALNTYNGPSTVNAGTLLINGTNSGTGPVTVSGTGKLAGKGTIAGIVTVNSGGILAPGNPQGILTVLSNLVVNSGAALNYDVGNSSDLVVVGGNLTLSGTLNITDSGGLGNTNSYTLFTYGGSLVVSGLTLGTVPPGKACQIDTSTPGQVNLLVGVIATNVLAFPGAVGFGAKVTGGRGGTVYHVTTLADSGPGSFRDAVSAGNRIIVFDVGGYISLGSAVSAKGSITIAGQTAPGGGIGFKGGEISFAGQNNIICRYIRVRPGSTTTSSTDDALSLYQAHNIIIDHSSVEFAPWNNFDGVGDSTHVLTNITVMNSIIADPTGQQFGAHTESVGGTWAWYYNIFANSHNRNPLAKINTIYVNNVNYNYSSAYTTHTSTPFKHDIINNYFMCGPASGGGGNTWFQIDNNQSMYFTGNLRDNNQNSTLDGVTTSPLPGYQGGGTILGTAWSTVTSNAPIYSPQSAYRMDASRAGALPLDEMDNLIVNQVKTLGNAPTGSGAGTAGPDGGLYTTQTATGLGNNGYGTITGGVAPLDSDGDAMPDYWETAVGLNANNANDATNLTLSGYTQLEVYLNWLAEPHAVVPINTNLDIDLVQYASGFTNVSPVYTFSNVVNGTVTLLLDGHTARYTPPTNFVGRASFLFKVAGNDGTSMTNVIGLVVTGTAPPQNLTWRGDGIANIWNVSTPTNWLNGANPAVFHTGDAVTFDDTGSNSPAINLAAAVAPGSLTVASSNDYTFGGTGGINGAVALNKSGSGTVALNTVNSYSSGTVISGGKVILGVSGAIGAGAVSLSGGSVQLAGNDFSNAVSIATTGTVIGNSSISDTLKGTVSGSGVWSLNVPAGRVITEESDCSGMSGAIALTGPGVYRMNFVGGSAWGNSNCVYDLGAAGTMNNRSPTSTNIYLGALTGGSGSQLRGSDQTGSFTDTVSVGYLNLDSIFAGTMQDGTGATPHKLALTKVGNGTLTLNGISIASGGMAVSSGTLVENGISGPGLTTVVSGAILAGTGTISGDLSAQSGGNVSPGLSAGSAGTLTVSNNLNLIGANLSFDFANVTTTGSSVNDLISLNGGSVNLSGVSTIVPNYLNGGLTTGNYTLINGGASTTGNAANLAWGGVANTRQSFVFDVSTPGTVRLQVGGSPATSLVWSGTNSSSWDFSTTNWLNSGAPDKFFNLDTVQFDDTSTNGNVVVTGTLLPTAIVVSNMSLAYSFSGGVISGVATLQKTGPASLTIANSNIFSGGTLLQSGDIFLANDTANQTGLGTGSITLGGGTLTMFSSVATTNATTWNLIVPPATTGGLNPDASCDIYGTLIGSGQLNLLVPAHQTTFYADWSAFAGRIHVATGTNGDFLIANLAGLPLAALDLSSNVTAFVPIDPSNDVTVDLGELSGSATAQLLGNLTESTLTWRVGGRNTDATFAGTIAEQSTNTTTAIEKIGSGTWTLTGNNSYAGDTHVLAGTLSVNNTTGNATGFGDVDVQYGATLAGNGIIGSDTTIENGATLAPGNSPGTLTFTNSLTLNDASVLQFELGTNSDKVIVNGLFTADGVLNVSNAGGFGPGTYTLFACNSNLVSIGSITLGSLPAGFTYAISTNTPGQINLVVTSTAAPQFGAISLTPDGLVLGGSGGTPSNAFYVITTTNITLPLNQWTPFATNYFDSNGNFLFTNTIDTNAPQGFYRLQLP